MHSWPAKNSCSYNISQDNNNNHMYETAEKLHKNTLKETLLSVQAKSKLTEQGQLQLEPYECHSLSVRPSPSSSIAVTSCHDSSLNSSAPHGQYRCVQKGPPEIFGKPLYKHLCPEFLSHFWKEWEDSVIEMGSTQEKEKVRKSLIQVVTSL